MFTGGTIRILTHSHIYTKPKSNSRGWARDVPLELSEAFGFGSLTRGKRGFAFGSTKERHSFTSLCDFLQVFFVVFFFPDAWCVSGLKGPPKWWAFLSVFVYNNQKPRNNGFPITLSWCFPWVFLSVSVYNHKLGYPQKRHTHDSTV